MDSVTIFDKLPTLSKVEKSVGSIIIKCPRTDDVLKKIILRFHENYTFTNITETDENVECVMKRKTILDNDEFIYNGSKMYLNVFDKQYSITDTRYKNVPLKHLFTFIKGFTCPKDKYFIYPRGNYYVLVEPDKVERYIYLPEYPSYIKEFNEHVEKYKADLMMNKFDKWYTWYDSGDIKEFEKHFSDEFILYDTKTNKSFIKSCIHFSNRFICMIPKYKDLELKKIVDLINTSDGCALKKIVVT